MKRALMVTGLFALLVTLASARPAHADVQLESGQNPGRCLGAEGGTVALGKYLNTSPCGAAGQLFVTRGAYYQFAGGGTAYCMTTQSPPNVGAAVWIDVCKNGPDGNLAANQQFKPGMNADINAPGDSLCIASTSVSGMSVTLAKCTGGQAVTQRWNARLVPAAPAGSSIALPITGISSRGDLLDARGSVIPNTAGSYILSGVKWLGGGNVMSDAGGHLAAWGGGNYSISLGGNAALVSTNGGNLAGILCSATGEPVRVVAQGAGNFTLMAGSRVLGVVAQGAGNVVAQGAGNVVGTGGGSLQITTSVLPPAQAAQQARAISINGSSLINQDGAGLANPAALAGLLIPIAGIGGLDGQGYLLNGAGQQILAAGPNHKLVKVTNNVLELNPSDLSKPTVLVDAQNRAYIVSHDGGTFSVKTSGGQVVAAGAGNVVSAGAGNILGNSSSGLISNSATRITGQQGSYLQVQLAGMNFQQAAFATGLSTSRTAMDAGDINSLNGKIAYYLNQPPAVTTNPYKGSPTPAPTPTATGSGFKLLGMTTSANPLAWSPSAPLPVSWTSSGIPPPNQTVTFFVVLSGQTTEIAVTTPIRVATGSTSGSASIPAPRGLSQPTPATLILKDDVNPNQRVPMAVTILPQAAQTPAYNGICNDPWVTKAVTAVTGRAPAGTANLGECAINRYGGGQWSSYPDLMVKVAQAFNWPRGGNCSDLLIVQATVDVRGVLPSGSGTSSQCNPQNYHNTNSKFYANGHWVSYAMLVRAVKDYYGLP